MIALGFEDIIVLVFHLPSSSSCLNDLGDRAPGEGKIGNKGILIEDFSGVGAGNRQFDPIDFKGCFAAIQGYLIQVAVGGFDYPRGSAQCQIDFGHYFAFALAASPADTPKKKAID